MIRAITPRRRSAPVLGLAAALALGTPGRAQTASEAGPDPIDLRLRTCLDGAAARATRAQLDCASEAYRAWDGALNEAYTTLLARLDPPARERLREAQRRWIAFRDADADFQAGASGGGTLGPVTAALAAGEVVRARALALRRSLLGPCGAASC